VNIAENNEQARVYKDSVGNVLVDGDTVTVIKDLKVKGSSLVVKVGTKVKNIRLIEGDHDIDCKIIVSKTTITGKLHTGTQVALCLYPAIALAIQDNPCLYRPTQLYLLLSKPGTISDIIVITRLANICKCDLHHAFLQQKATAFQMRLPKYDSIHKKNNSCQEKINRIQTSCVKRKNHQNSGHDRFLTIFQINIGFYFIFISNTLFVVAPACQQLTPLFPSLPDAGHSPRCSADQDRPAGVDPVLHPP
jgi:hypothetical protein